MALSISVIQLFFHNDIFDISVYRNKHIGELKTSFLPSHQQFLVHFCHHSFIQQMHLECSPIKKALVNVVALIKHFWMKQCTTFSYITQKEQCLSYQFHWQFFFFCQKHGHLMTFSQLNCDVTNYSLKNKKGNLQIKILQIHAVTL